MLDAGRRPTVQ